MGVQDINPFPLSYNVFTTFLKARVACVSGGANGDTPYYYDELRTLVQQIFTLIHTKIYPTQNFTNIYAYKQEKFYVSQILVKYLYGCFFCRGYLPS